MFKDYYSILEANIDFDEKQLKDAYRKQVLKWHPDKNRSVDTTFQMQEINEAYLILGDKEAKSKYDIEYISFKNYYSKQRNENQNNNQNSQQKNRTNYEENFDYKIQDDILQKWINNARKQAKNLANEALFEIKEVTKDATRGCFNGIIQLIITVIVINILFLIFGC